MNDVDAGVQNPDELPQYALSLAAFHKAFAPELREMVQSLPLNGSDSVLDMGSGDGFYSELLSRRLEKTGRLTGVDSNRAFNEYARRRLAKQNSACPIQFLEGKLESLTGNYDLIWCAQSLFSFPEPIEAIGKMVSALKPRGFLAILENDSLHQLLLPWSPCLEMEIRNAERRVNEKQSAHAQKFYVGRRLPSLFAECNLEPTQYKTQAINRKAPFSPELRFFVKDYLEELTKKLHSELAENFVKELKEFNLSIWNDPHVTLTWLNFFAVGRKSENESNL